jgi:uncharacterized integral membrane protein
MAKKYESKKAKLSIDKVFNLFCKETSLHGWSYFSQEKMMTKVWKMLFAAFILVIIIVSFALIWNNTSQVTFFDH